MQVVDEATPGLAGRIHVSGHARKEDLRVLYEALKPRIAVPMHGEHRHLVEHSAFAASLQVPAIPAPNGTVVAIDGAKPRILDEVQTGRLYLDGQTLVGVMDGVVRSRLKLARQGHVIISLVIDESGELLADPEIRVLGGPGKSHGWPAPLADLPEPCA